MNLIFLSISNWILAVFTGRKNQVWNRQKINFVNVEISKIKCRYIKTVRKRMFLYKWPLYDLFWPFFCHVYLHLPQNWGSDGHFEEVNKSNLWLVQNLWHKTQIFPFLFLLRFGTKTDICLFCVFCVLVFFVITFVPIKI